MYEASFSLGTLKRRLASVTTNFVKLTALKQSAIDLKCCARCYYHGETSNVNEVGIAEIERSSRDYLTALGLSGGHYLQRFFFSLWSLGLSFFATRRPKPFLVFFGSLSGVSANNFLFFLPKLLLFYGTRREISRRSLTLAFYIIFGLLCTVYS